MTSDTRHLLSLRSQQNAVAFGNGGVKMRPMNAYFRFALPVFFFSFGCQEHIEFSIPGRAPPVAGDFVVSVDGTPRGFGKAELARDAKGPIVSAEILETSDAITIHLPTKASVVSCEDIPNAIVLTSASPREHANTSYRLANWTATKCTITVSRIDATATQGAEGSFSGTLVRGDEVGGLIIDAPKTLSVEGTFIVRVP